MSQRDSSHRQRLNYASLALNNRKGLKRLQIQNYTIIELCNIKYISRKHKCERGKWQRKLSDAILNIFQILFGNVVWRQCFEYLMRSSWVIPFNRDLKQSSETPTDCIQGAQKPTFPLCRRTNFTRVLTKGLKFDMVRQSLYTECNYGGHSDGLGRVARKRGRGARLFLVSWLSRMAASGLTEDDIPGASLAGRSPTTLKNEELRFWLKWRIEVWNSGRGMSITMVSA